MSLFSLQKTFLCLIILLSASYSSLKSQTVTVLYQGELLDGPDGMAIDKKGNIYVANWGKKGNGSTIVKFDNQLKGTILIDSLGAPDGLTFDKEQNLYISNYKTGEILKWSTTQVLSTYFRINGHPSGITFDKKGNLYISDFGKFNGTNLYKVTPSKDSTLVHKNLQQPIGLTFDKHNNLYISNFGSGLIHKLDKENKISIFARIPSDLPRLQYLIYKNNNLYVPSYSHNCIYIINMKGEVKKVDKFINTGTGETYSLDGPNSIAFNQKGDIFITEFNKGSLLKVSF